jgi:hypothetical protein
MKARLLFPDRDADLTAEPSDHDQDLVRDLGLETVVDAMAAGDQLVRTVAQKCLLAPSPSVEEIRYRQGVLRDCLDHPDEIRALHELAILGAESKRRTGLGLIGNSPSSILYWSTGVLKELARCLETLRDYSETNGQRFRSDGLAGLMATIDRDLDTTYLATVKDHLNRLQFPTGVHLTGSVGADGMGTDYMLVRPASVRWSWRSLVDWLSRPPTYTYRIAERDELGAQTLGRLRNVGVNLVADAASRSADHILDFFNQLRSETAFYVGCLNLHERLKRGNGPLCFPDPEPAERLALDASGLVDAGLLLRGAADLVPNNLPATGKRLVMVTGANQGGKSTLLRAVGLAQVMTQAGMFVTAERYRVSTAPRLLTHYRREEDSALSHGKLDEELSRLSSLLEVLEPGVMVLFNESFASTNEREGSQVAREVIEALTESGVRVLFVTHLFTLAQGLAEQHHDDALFLRAERQPDGTRTFRLEPGPPEPTSYGKDLYDDVFAPAEGA